MKYMNKGIVDIHNALINNEVTVEELINESLEISNNVQKDCNAFVTILDKDKIKKSEVNDNLLSGIPYGVKDNNSTKGILSTGSSNTLKDYVPFFDATAIENLSCSGAIMVNKTVLDEFGMGGTGTTGHTGKVLNPWDRSRMCAGSSSGSACAVASGVYPYATGSDTGDSIRKPAAYCGIVGYKPTYGMISRYGLFPFASSLDTCGVLTRSVEDAAIVVDAMKGKDKKDMTSWDSSNINLFKSLNSNVKNKKLCYVKGPAKKFDDKVEMISDEYNILDEHLQIGNFGGFPSITIPDGFVNDLPVGVNITGKCYDDSNVLNIAYAIEGTMNYKNQIAKEVNHE